MLDGVCFAQSDEEEVLRMKGWTRGDGSGNKLPRTELPSGAGTDGSRRPGTSCAPCWTWCGLSWTVEIHIDIMTYNHSFCFDFLSLCIFG